MLFSFRFWNVIFLWSVYCSLSLGSVTAKFSRAIIVENYFYPKIEAGKVFGFVCWSGSVVQLTVVYPPHLELQTESSGVVACFSDPVSHVSNLSLLKCSKTHTWTHLSLMEEQCSGVEAGSDSDFTGLLSVHCEVRQEWTGSRSPAQLWVCQLWWFAQCLHSPSDLDSWVPSRPLST